MKRETAADRRTRLKRVKRPRLNSRRKRRERQPKVGPFSEITAEEMFNSVLAHVEAARVER